jgi:hypothetical protein
MTILEFLQKYRDLSTELTVSIRFWSEHVRACWRHLVHGRLPEGITTDGVLTWQSQPNQTFETPQVKQLIAHDTERANVRLFLRTRERTTGRAVLPYTYLGRLSYVTHNDKRERPVYF